MLISNQGSQWSGTNTLYLRNTHENFSNTLYCSFNESRTLIQWQLRSYKNGKQQLGSYRRVILHEALDTEKNKIYNCPLIKMTKEREGNVSRWWTRFHTEAITQWNKHDQSYKRNHYTGSNKHLPTSQTFCWVVCHWHILNELPVT